MQMWLYRADLDGYTYDVVDSDDDTKSDDDVIEQHLKAYTDIIKHSEDELPTEAIQPLEALLSYYPNHEALLIRLTHLRYQGSLKQGENNALETLQLILAVHPKHEEALKLTIDIYFTQRQFASAVPLLTTLIECEPDVVNHFALRRRAEAYHALNQLDKALVDLEQALSRNAFTQAVSRRESREYVANWQNHNYFHKQPLLPLDDTVYGVIEDEYKTYDESDEYDACLYLKDMIEDKIKEARGAFAFHQPASDKAGDEQPAKHQKCMDMSGTF